MFMVIFWENAKDSSSNFRSTKIFGKSLPSGYEIYIFEKEL